MNRKDLELGSGTESGLEEREKRKGSNRSEEVGSKGIEIGQINLGV